MAYADTFSAATKRWMEDFGSAISQGWDLVVAPTFNVAPVDSDESSLPLPVPASMVEAVLGLSQDSPGSTTSTVALQGSPVTQSPVAVPSAARVSFARALGLVQLPLTTEAETEAGLDLSVEYVTEEGADNTISFIEE